MLLDYVSPERKRPEEGVRVAGLLDLVQLAKALGKKIDAGAVRDMKSAAKLDPMGVYSESGTFIDPIGRLMSDIGTSYQGRPMQSYSSLEQLRNEGQTIREYLDNNEIVDALGPKFDDIRVGLLDGRGPAGFVSPRDGQQGFMYFESNAARNGMLPQYFEHEMQHAYQSALNMPRGTSPDEMSDDMARYLVEIGALRPAQGSRIDAAASAAKIPRGDARYLATIGEAEARAAQSRQAGVDAGVPYGDLGPPQLDQYSWTPRGYTVGAKDFFPLAQDADVGFNDWWKRQWQR